MAKYAEPTADRMTGTVECDHCGQTHPAEFDHMGRFDPETPYYAVECTVDYLTDYYADFRVTFEARS